MKGQCLCGAVRLVAPDSREVGVCHCGYCRRWGGGPLLTAHCGPDLVVEGSEHVGVYASSDWAERAFCKLCGSHLYYRLRSTGAYFVPAGLLDGQHFELVMQIYIDCKPDYYELANQTPVYTEQQVIEMFAGAAEPGADAATRGT